MIHQNLKTPFIPDLHSQLHIKMYKNEQHYKMLLSKVIDLLRKKHHHCGAFTVNQLFSQSVDLSSASETNETNKKKKTDLDKEGSVFRFIVKTGT